MLLALLFVSVKVNTATCSNNYKGQGFVRARVDGEIIDIDTPPELDKRKTYH